MAEFIRNRWKVFEISNKKELIDISKQKLLKKLLKYKKNLKFLSVLWSERS